MKILILGGTGEARVLANRLVALGHDVTTSLAGRTSEPKLPQGNVRVGKFGGVAGLSAYLSAGGFDRLVDATHPYAGAMSVNAVGAATATGVPLVRLMRAPWVQSEGDGWRMVGSVEEAAAALPHRASVLLTTGHAGLETFLKRNDCRFVIRVIEAPGFPLPPNARLLLTRPPFTLDEELKLMRHEGITCLVSKNSGGRQTAAKLEAARQLGVQVVMIERPVYPPATEVGTVDKAMDALHLD